MFHDPSFIMIIRLEHGYLLFAAVANCTFPMLNSAISGLVSLSSHDFEDESDTKPPQKISKPAIIQKSNANITSKYNAIIKKVLYMLLYGLSMFNSLCFPYQV